MQEKRERETLSIEKREHRIDNTRYSTLHSSRHRVVHVHARHMLGPFLDEHVIRLHIDEHLKDSDAFRRASHSARESALVSISLERYFTRERDAWPHAYGRVVAWCEAEHIAAIRVDNKLKSHSRDARVELFPRRPL